jgi:predicted AAA+ superfamily ATPase
MFEVMDLILYIRIMWRVLGLRRVRLKFAPGLEVEFCDRVRGIKQVYEFAERGTRFPVVVYGPEGCGKTA